MCSSCQAFAKDWEETVEKVHGLHFAEVNIDKKEAIGLAERFGVLEEGIPNVKLFNAAETALPIVTGATPTAATVAADLAAALQSSGAQRDAGGYYLTSHGRAEL